MLENKMVMTGLPIRRDFALQADALGDRTTQEGKEYQAKIREELGIDKEKKMVLVMGGGEGEWNEITSCVTAALCDLISLKRCWLTQRHRQ